jgi:hypothetical protein
MEPKKLHNWMRDTDTGLVVMESGKKTGPKKRVEEIVGETCMKK